MLSVHSGFAIIHSRYAYIYSDFLKSCYTVDSIDFQGRISRCFRKKRMCCGISEGFATACV